MFEGGLSIGADGTMYVAAGLCSSDRPWGSPTAETALLVSSDGGKTFAGQMLSPPDPETPNWLVNIERNTGHHPVDVPWVMYTHGVAGERNDGPETTVVRLVGLGRRVEGAETVRVGGVVVKWIAKEKALNYERVEPLIRQAARRGAKIVCTTESFLDGYSIRDKEMPLEAFQALGEEIPGGAYDAKLAALADELDIHLIAGLLRFKDGKTYNSAVVFDPDGKRLGVYHKQHLGHESVRNTPGASCPTFETPYGKLGVMICMDRQDPEVTRGLVDNGADLIIVPSGGMWGPTKNDPHLRRRSRESGLPIVFVHPIEWLVTGPGGEIWDRDYRGHRMDLTPEETGGADDAQGVFLFDLPIRRAKGSDGEG
jgi:predicted amidohydrolase